MPRNQNHSGHSALDLGATIYQFYLNVMQHLFAFVNVYKWRNYHNSIASDVRVRVCLCVCTSICIYKFQLFCKIIFINDASHLNAITSIYHTLYVHIYTMCGTLSAVRILFNICDGGDVIIHRIGTWFDCESINDCVIISITSGRQPQQQRYMSVS